MKVISLHDKARIERFLRQETDIHLYELGDLDDFFWEHTTWYGLLDHRELEAVLLLYTTSHPPVLLANSRGPSREMVSLLKNAAAYLPRRIYAHAHPATLEALQEVYRIRSHGLHHKMTLQKPSCLNRYQSQRVNRLGTSDRPQLESLYRESYPGNWFDPRMLETGYYFGIKEDSRMIAVAGVHVVSTQYRVAALGNITTHPRHRGRGLCSSVTARLCHALLETVDVIGLNVKADNHGAIACYRKLGFKIVSDYQECTLDLI
jgi:RimJ/RimL family protein N-acetyltransferase